MSGWKGHPRDLMPKEVVAPEQTEGDRLRINKAERKRLRKKLENRVLSAVKTKTVTRELVAEVQAFASTEA
jgi:hypothetical protein